MNRENLMRESLSDLEAQRAINIETERQRREEARAKSAEIAALLDERQKLFYSGMRGAFASPEKAKQISRNMKTEMERLNQKLRAALVQNGLPEDYLQPVYRCAICKDTGYVDGKKCHCFQKAAIDYLYTQSNLQEILDRENFNTCSLEYYSSNHIDRLTGRSSLEAMKTALKTCHEFVDTFSTDFRNILMYGDTGVGKTFLSHCIAKELLEQSYSVIYFTASQLFDILAKYTFEKDADAGLAHDHVLDCDLLIIDDLGTEFANSFTTSQLFICLNERILRKKSTLISTNLALEDIRNIYSERIFSRITSTYTVLRMTGDDIRIQKKLMNKY